MVGLCVLTGWQNKHLFISAVNSFTDNGRMGNFQFKYYIAALSSCNNEKQEQAYNQYLNCNGIGGSRRARYS